MHNPPMTIPILLDRAGSSAPSKRVALGWWAFALASLLMVAAAVWIAGGIGQSRATAALETQGRTDASLSAALLRTVLEKQGALPFVLSEDSELRSALATKEHGALDRLNRKLEGIAGATQASAIYVIGLDGVAVAASNWREPTSFVGVNYSFREYYRHAMKDGSAEHFALGNISKKPGLYISRRIGGDDGTLGVVVVKVVFDQVEADWKASGKLSYVTDPSGVVLITSLPSWRFMTRGEIPADRLLAIRDSLQFGDAPLRPLPFENGKDDLVRVVLPGDAGRTNFIEIRTPVPTTDWELRQLVPVNPAVTSGMREARMSALLIFLPLVGIAAFLLRRRQAVAMRIAREQRARVELERRVAERTQALTLARDRLEAEISGRRTTEQALQTVQQELVQANRLAILGQVAAGVAHEINQPVATIRAYADNARTFLERGQTTPAGENLESIAALTERIGTITEELKTFSRKGRAAAEPTNMRDVVEGALLLLRSRFSTPMGALDISLPSGELSVMGNRIRLEQVLINLIQNALEAVAPQGDAGRVKLHVDEMGCDVVVTVADNGPGISAEIRDHLFIPFNSSKEDGLGLGLVISKDIVADYGGRIEVVSTDAGTCFTVHLTRA